MKYKNIRDGVFLLRPNRFIAEVMVGGKREICHVKNTGRCRELLFAGARVILEESENPSRKTRYDLVAVYKGSELINIDSISPNKVFGEWVNSSGYFGNPNLIKPECKYKNSRFDFDIENENRRIFAEIKGVTLEENGVVMFPDAPTERGLKHINELVDAKENGYEAYAFFIIQMKNCRYFTPNRNTHPEFADSLIHDKEKGVNLRALNCTVTPNSIEIDDFVEILL